MSDPKVGNADLAIKVIDMYAREGINGLYGEAREALGINEDSLEVLREVLDSGGKNGEITKAEREKLLKEGFSPKFVKMFGPNGKAALYQRVKWLGNSGVKELKKQLSSQDAPSDSSMNLLDDVATKLREIGPVAFEYAAKELAALGPEVVPLLIEALKGDYHDNFKALAAKSLGIMGPDAEEAIPALNSIVENAPECYFLPLLEAAIKTMGQIGSEKAVPALKKALKNGYLKDLHPDIAKAVKQIRGAAKGFATTSDYAEIRDTLLQLDYKETLWRKKGVSTDELVEKLEDIGRSIENLRPQYQDDPGFQLVEKMYQDLHTDHNEGRSWDLDSSMHKIGGLLNERMKEAEIERVETSALSGKLKKTAKKLEGLGIAVEYAVPAADQENAPTVILMIQCHGGTNFKLSSEAEDSQGKIETYMHKLADKGVVKTIFPENHPVGQPYKVPEDKKFNNASDRVARARDDIRMYGCENPWASAVYFIEDLELDHRDCTDVRVTLGTIFAAQNLNMVMKKKKIDMAIVPMGAAHEDIYFYDKTRREALSPSEFVEFSKIAAFAGTNVLVVNTVKKPS